MATSAPSSTYNVFFLGETQSGKLILIQALKQYSNPKFTVSSEAYEDKLNERKAYVLERAKSNDTKATFKLIDTHGLNDTALFDKSNFVTIFKALEDINALQAYIDLLPEFNGNIVFVHTKADYTKPHPNETHFARALAEKENTLHRMMGRDSIPHLLIDNDIGSRKTIRNCITQNKLRELLAMAKLNQPVPLQVMMMKKTEKTRIVDQIPKAKFDEVIKASETILGFKNQVQKEVLARIT
ncbi:hypothetical protein BG000_009220 [Podila horticola]|nr:hypothetical protein BG000_009220 [Podila horticola]